MTSLKKRALFILLLAFSLQTLCATVNSELKETTATTQLPDLPMRSDNNVQDLKIQNRKIAALAAEELSKTLPQTIDKYTQLVNVKNEDLTLIYVFEIATGNKSDAIVKKEDHARMQSAVTYGVCRSSQRFLEAQINISYLYRSAKTKADLFRFDITQADCIRGIN